jgi:hypothetical protein
MSFLRKQESRLLLTAFWIPAYAGMTDQGHLEKANLDKPEASTSICSSIWKIKNQNVFY